MGLVVLAVAHIVVVVGDRDGGSHGVDGHAVQSLQCVGGLVAVHAFVGVEPAGVDRVAGLIANGEAGFTKVDALAVAIHREADAAGGRVARIDGSRVVLAGKPVVEVLGGERGGVRSHTGHIIADAVQRGREDISGEDPIPLLRCFTGSGQVAQLRSGPVEHHVFGLGRCLIGLCL